MLMMEAMLNFPHFSKTYHVNNDASDYQLGATVVQDEKTLAFYTRKLNSTQQKYTVGEKQLLGIIEGLKAFEGILRVQVITVHTDHLNLLYKKLPSQRMIPQSNSILERLHQVKGNALRTFDLDIALLRPEEPFEEFTTASAYAIRCSHHQTLRATPAQRQPN